MSQIRLWWLVLAAALGCGGGWPEVVDVRELGGSLGGPEIGRVRDLGNPDLPARGALTGAEPDGMATPGELVLIEGSGFGRQPTVMVSGRPAAVLARTSGGGIIVRTPTAIAPGTARIDVSTAKGRAEAGLPVRRYALVAVGEKNHLHVLEVGRDEAHPFGHPVEIADAQLVRFAFDGSAAYVVAQAAGGPRLHTIDITAPQGPRLVSTQDIPERHIVAAAAAEAAPMLALVGESQLLLYDLGATKRPARWAPLALPEAVAKAQVAQVALDPQGKTLAVLTARGNQVRFYDVSNPRDKRLVTTVDVLPDQRTALVRDMQFSTDGETLWVVSGDNALSLGAGPQPTRLTAIRLLPPNDNQEGPRVVSVWRTMPVPGAAAPLGLAVSRGQPLASGTTIRIPPEKAAVFITGVQSALFQLAGLALATPAGVKKADAVLRPIAQPGMIVRANINGGGGPLFATPQVLSSVDLTPDAQVVIATACRVVPGGDQKLDLSFGVVSAALWGRPAPKFVPLEKVSVDVFRPPFRLGQVRIQP